MGCREVLNVKRSTWYSYIGIPFESHVDTTMLDLARYCSWRIEMCKRVTFFFCKWINCFNVGKLCCWELSEALFRFNLLLLDNFELFFVVGLFEREGSSCCLWSFRSWLHSKYCYISYKSLVLETTTSYSWPIR